MHICAYLCIQVEAHEEKHGLHWDEHGGHDPPPPRGGHKRSEASDTDNDNDNTRGRSRNESNANSDGSAAAGRGEGGGEAEAKREGGPSDAEIEAIFRKFDTSGDGFMGECGVVTSKKCHLGLKMDLLIEIL